MRYEDRDVKLWVDTACIDEGNNVERNHQVWLVTEVYSTAREVFLLPGRRPPRDRFCATSMAPESLSITQASARNIFRRSLSTEWRILYKT
ncbi:hypothetical protein HD806DRAFT_481030 [Xylariaceae sp. AK1471]|nr:hypothetical protein HD806DRAFT_481030 [Xylariaceae sp. AK1471]